MEKWTKHGQYLKPDLESKWLVSHAGATAVNKVKDNTYDLYVTGRDKENRSVIGRCTLFLGDEIEIINNNQVVFSHGDLGAFDENGVSYPCVVNTETETYLYYTGWMPTVLTPFQNHLGLAKKEKNGSFHRVSRAPILHRTDEDYLSIGSSFILKEENKWKMWYTSFAEWGGGTVHKYFIKYAESKNGVDWQRDNIVCLKPIDDLECCIAKPTVIKHNGIYHMWFCHRGENYKIGYAYSENGIDWTRRDDMVGIDADLSWEDSTITYPTVFKHNNKLYMIYCGGKYGVNGLGVASMPIELL